MADRRVANAKELRYVGLIALIDAQMERASDQIGDRIRTIPNGPRQLGLIKWSVGQLIAGVYDTLPQHQLEQLQRLATRGEVRIDQIRADRGDGWIELNRNQAQTLVGVILTQVCAVCLKMPDEMRKCDVRKALDCVAPANEILPHMCPYFLGNR